MTRTFHPIALHLAGRACLVVGTGEALDNRARSLLDAGAQVHIVSTEARPALAGQPAVRFEHRDFKAEDLDGKWLALLVGRDAALAERVAPAAEARQVFFCAIDLPEYSSFSHM